MLFPVRWTALRRCVWTVSAPARLAAALRFSTVGSLGSQGLTQLGELAWVSCTHGGRRYGQGGGHGDRPWLRPHQWEHSCHQSRDHRVVQVGALRCWCRCVCVRVWGASRALGAFCWNKKTLLLTFCCSDEIKSVPTIYLLIMSSFGLTISGLKENFTNVEMTSLWRRRLKAA